MIAALVALSIRSGIAPSAWLTEPPEILDLALNMLLEEE